MRQTFTRECNRLTRTVEIGDRSHSAAVGDLSDDATDAEAAWWQSSLRNATRAAVPSGTPVRIVDAFCGSGGFALGVAAAVEAVGRVPTFSAIVDTDATALAIHRHNLGARRTLATSVASLVDFHVLGVGGDATFGYPPEVVDPNLAKSGRVDMFIAGPPCQGHSNLNNHTRRQDPRNDLYVTAIALGVALDAEIVLVENVPTVQNSHSDVVATAAGLLRSSGYGVSMAVVRADRLGAAQTRARHFLLGVKGRSLTPNFLASTVDGLAAPARPLSWAIGDLVDGISASILDSSPAMTPVNVARVDYLFDHDLYDLPDDRRPDCHKNGTSYTAVYGRMHWDKPAQTITTGFGTPGQGRFVHPLRRRLITPHEAARIQGFPDWFDFSPPEVALKRKHLAKWIGDAVHPVLGYAVGLAALAASVDGDRTSASTDQERSAPPRRTGAGDGRTSDYTRELVI